MQSDNRFVKKLLARMNDQRGVAGLDVFLAVITMLFAIGLVVMIFVLLGQNLEDNSSITGTDAAITINATKQALSSATDFFGVIILITSMVVLVLLTVIIIRALRSGGLTGGGGA